MKGWEFLLFLEKGVLCVVDLVMQPLRELKRAKFSAQLGQKTFILALPKSLSLRHFGKLTSLAPLS